MGKYQSLAHTLVSEQREISWLLMAGALKDGYSTKPIGGETAPSSYKVNKEKKIYVDSHYQAGKRFLNFYQLTKLDIGNIRDGITQFHEWTIHKMNTDF